MYIYLWIFFALTIYKFYNGSNNNNNDSYSYCYYYLNMYKCFTNHLLLYYIVLYHIISRVAPTSSTTAAWRPSLVGSGVFNCVWTVDSGPSGTELDTPVL